MQKKRWCLKEKKVIGSCQFLFNSGKTPQAVMPVSKAARAQDATLSFGKRELPVVQPMAITLSFPYSSFSDYDMC